MAIQPELQILSERKMIRSHIGVITNARPDHLDVMGPTVRDVALALAGTIPRKAKAFTAENQWFELLDETMTIWRLVEMVSVVSVAEIVTVKLPAVVGDPETSPVAGSTLSPEGSPETPKVTVPLSPTIQTHRGEKARSAHQTFSRSGISVWSAPLRQSFTLSEPQITASPAPHVGSLVSLIGSSGSPDSPATSPPR